MKKITVLILLILLSVVISGQQSGNSSQTKTRLERMKVKDVSKQLSPREREELVELFLRNCLIAWRQGQKSELSLQTPIYQLLKANFPKLAEREQYFEGEGKLIFLWEIMKYFNSTAEYRHIVDRILQEERKNGKCKK